MPKLIVIAICAILSSCQSASPYVAIRHVDATPIRGGDDGWDVACFGLKRRGQLELKAGYCANARGGEMFEAGIEYELLP